MEILLQYLGYARRKLLQHYGFTVIVVLTLALGIGANTAIFSLVYAILLRPFPYQQPDRLVRVETVLTKASDSVQGGSLLDLADWNEHAKSIGDFGGYITFDNVLTGSGPAQSVNMTFASPEIFTALGIRPIIGRLYTAEDNRSGADINKVLLSYGLWQARFGGKQNIIGEVIHLRGTLYTVIGVLPPEFRFPARSDVWAPLIARYATYQDPWWRPRDIRIHNVLARLKPDVTSAQAQREMDVLAESLAKEFPATNDGVQLRLTSLRDAEVGSMRPYLLLLIGAAGLVLLICCVNVANLLLARASLRAREIAIRTALGSSRARIVQLLLTESLMLSILGGTLGVLLAYPGLRLLLGLIPVSLPFWMKIEIDNRVLLFSLAITLLTTIIFGLLPALQQSRADLNLIMKDGAKGTQGSKQIRWLHNLLVSSEIALSLFLLIGAGLMMKSFVKLQQVEPGIDTKNLITVQTNKYIPKTTPVEAEQVYPGKYREISDRLAALPGVVAVANGNDFPFNYPEPRMRGEIAIRAEHDQEIAVEAPLAGAVVSPGYFTALGIPMLAGRDFTEADNLNSPSVVLISQHAAQSLWLGRDAIGQQIRWGRAIAGNNNWCTVIGIVGNTKWNGMEDGSGYEIYFSYRQQPGSGAIFLLRTQGNPHNLEAAVRQVVQELDTDMAVVRVRTMDEAINESLWQRRLWGVVFIIFAGIALILAAVGVYGVISYLVSQRTREIGVRIALGAQTGDVVRLIMADGLKLVAIGATAGIATSLALTRLIAHLLFATAAVDPAIYLGVSAILIFVAMIACFIPAYRASKSDPLVALRYE